MNRNPFSAMDREERRAFLRINRGPGDEMRSPESSASAAQAGGNDAGTGVWTPYGLTFITLPGPAWLPSPGGADF